MSDNLEKIFASDVFNKEPQPDIEELTLSEMDPQETVYVLDESGNEVPMTVQELMDDMEEVDLDSFENHWED